MGIFSKLFGKKKEEPNQLQQKAEEITQEPQGPKYQLKHQRHILDNVEQHEKDVLWYAHENADYELSWKELIEEDKEKEKIFQYEMWKEATLEILGGGVQSKKRLYKSLLRASA